MFKKKYRPKNFDEFLGNDEIVNSLLDIVEDYKNKKEFAHAYMFVGRKGLGKTTIGRILARELGADQDSIVEINAAKERNLEMVRDIEENAKYLNWNEKTKAYIIDEIQGSNSYAQEALLKVVEECPNHVIFIFCTTNPNKIKDTLIDRCLVYNMRPMSRDNMLDLIDHVCNKEKIIFEDIVVEAMIKSSNGSPRQLLVNMYKCMRLSSKDAIVLMENTIEGVRDEVVDICKLFFTPRNFNWKNLMKKVDGLVKEESADSVRHMMFDYFSKTLKNSNGLKDVAKWTAVLETLDCRIEEGSNGTNSLVYLLGRIVTGLMV